MTSNRDDALSSNAHQQAARELLDGMRLAPAELLVRLEQAVSPEYWRTLAPALTVAGQGAAEPAFVTEVDAATRRATLSRFETEGYFVLPPLVSVPLLERLRHAVTALGAAGWPPVFVWMYDEVWRVPRLQTLVTLVSEILGADYVQTPNVWTHVVPGYRGAMGWRPHVDHQGADSRLTVWVPLTDATVDTGCLCVVPKHLVPRSVAGRWYDRPTLDMREAMDVVHAARPLPAAAGSVLGWDTGLLHWGAARERAGEPRVSVSMEFAVASGGDILDGERFPVRSGEVPSLEARLRTIARSIVSYFGSDPRAGSFLDLADALVDRLGRD